MRSTRTLKKAVTKRRQQAKAKGDASVRLVWKLKDGTVVRDLPAVRPGKPAVTITLDASASASAPEWFTDAGPDLEERRQHPRHERVPAGWEVCVDSPDRLHVMLKRTLLPDPNRPRGQRPWPLTESDQREAARRYVAEVEAGRRTAHWDHEELLIMAGLYQERDPSRGIPLHEVLALADPPPPPPLKPWQKGYFSCGGRYR